MTEGINQEQFTQFEAMLEKMVANVETEEGGVIVQELKGSRMGTEKIPKLMMELP